MYKILLFAYVNLFHSKGFVFIQNEITVQNENTVVKDNLLQSSHQVPVNLSEVQTNFKQMEADGFTENNIAASSTCLPSHEKKKKRELKPVSLPGSFSRVLDPLLEGHMISEQDHARLSSILKDELILFLNQENMIVEGNSSSLRWQYRDLGETLMDKYPKMIWDLPSKRQKKVKSSKAPIYGTFIRRLSERRKMQRLRSQKKEAKSVQPADIIVEVEVSQEDALVELTSVTYEAVKNETNTERITHLLKKSFSLRQNQELSKLPPYLMVQKYLEVEVELRFETAFGAMVVQLKNALKKMAAHYSIPETVLEMEKLMQPKRSCWNAISMIDLTDDAKRPGPSIFFGERPCIMANGGQVIGLKKDCSLEEAAILLLGVYFILNLSFPAAYGQFLGLLQNILTKDKFPKSFSSRHLLAVTANVSL
ncbi:uncharacterized protein LOC129218294 [Uloborus diversus]|uniref:uncharacterized protein LOC129218294 n=1 Tax=Uloborus diversus TaxID=327109 RepID=UPI002409AAFE|nr:uncharacterized protein LOC129218294 [Uloborus diversus]